MAASRDSRDAAAKDAPKGSPPSDDVAVSRWDRSRWISVFSSHNPTIREVTECLGLGLSASSSTTNRGIPKFDNPDYRRLSNEVTRLSKELPKLRDSLLDFAANPRSLDKELEDLLATFGPAIWGRDSDRSCLLSPDPSKKTYPKDLFYEVPEDKEVLKIHLHRWIIIKACYYIRNMKLKRPLIANDYDILADMDVDGEPLSPAKPLLSPNGTPMSITPPTDKSVGGKKRKSSVYMSTSDGDDMASTPAKRPVQAHTMPIHKKSPRKSLKSFTGSPVSENTPPVPSLERRPSTLPSTAGPVTASETGRPLLTPLSSNDLNGTARSASTASPTNGFTAVNSGGSFTAVNTAIPVKETPPPQNPPQVNGRNYSSPYDSNSYSAQNSQNGPSPPSNPASNPPKGPPLNTSQPVGGFQAINSPIVTNGASARNSPVVPHKALSQAPSQQVQAQTTSRSNTPVHRPSLAYKRSSRSNTPIAPALAVQPVQPVQSDQPSQPPTSVNVPLAPMPPVQPGPVTHVHAVAQGRVPPVPVAPATSVPSVVQYVPQAQSILKSQMVESSMPPQPDSFDLLQCEVLGGLMQYLFPRHSSHLDEPALLHRIETLWHQGTPIFRKQIGPLYDLQSKVLLSWITERRKIAQLRHALAYAPGVPASEMVDRLLAMNDLRVMRLKWKNMSSADGLSAEDLLCSTFSIITNTAGTEYLFKDGLDKLSEGVFEFLRHEDMRILMHKR